MNQTLFDFAQELAARLDCRDTFVAGTLIRAALLDRQREACRRLCPLCAKGGEPRSSNGQWLHEGGMARCEAGAVLSVWS